MWEGLNYLYQRFGVSGLGFWDLETIGFTSQSLGGAGQRGARLLSPGAQMLSQAAQPFPTMFGGAFQFQSGKKFGALAVVSAGQSILAEEMYRQNKILPRRELEILIGKSGLDTKQKAELFRELSRNEGLTTDLLQKLGLLAGTSAEVMGKHVSVLNPAGYHNYIQDMLRAPGVLSVGFNAANFDIRYMQAMGFTPPLLDIYPIHRRILKKILPASFFERSGAHKLDTFINEVVTNFDSYRGQLDPEVEAALRQSFSGWLNKRHAMHNPYVDALATKRLTDFIFRLATVRHDVRSLVESGIRAQGFGDFGELAVAEARNYLFGKGKFPAFSDPNAVRKRLQALYGEGFANRFSSFWELFQRRAGGRGELIIGEAGELFARVKGVPKSTIALPAQMLSQGPESALVTRGRATSFARRLLFRAGSEYKTMTPTEAFYSVLEHWIRHSTTFNQYTAGGMFPHLVRRAMETELRKPAGLLPGLKINQALQGTPALGHRARHTSLIPHRFSAEVVEAPEAWVSRATLKSPLESENPLLRLQAVAGELRKESVTKFRGEAPAELQQALNETFESIAGELKRMGVEAPSGLIKPEALLEGAVPLPGAAHYYPAALSKRAAEKGIYQIANAALITPQGMEWLAKSAAAGLEKAPALPNPVEIALEKALSTSLLRKRLAIYLRGEGKISSAYFGVPLLVMEASMRELGDTGAQWFGQIPKALLRRSEFPAMTFKVRNLEQVKRLLKPFAPNKVDALVQELLATDGPKELAGMGPAIKKSGWYRLLNYAGGLKAPEELRGLPEDVSMRLKRVLLSMHGGRAELKVWTESILPELPAHAAGLLGAGARVQPTGLIASSSKFTGLLTTADVMAQANAQYVKAAHLADIARRAGLEVPKLTGLTNLAEYNKKLERLIKLKDPWIDLPATLRYRIGRNLSRSKVRATEILEGIPFQKAMVMTRRGYFDSMLKLVGYKSGRLYLGVPFAQRADSAVGALMARASGKGYTITQVHQLRSAARLLGYTNPEDYLPYKLAAGILRKRGIELTEGPRLRLLDKGVGGDLKAALAVLGRPPEELAALTKGRTAELVGGRRGLVRLGEKMFAVPEPGELRFLTKEAVHETFLGPAYKGTYYLPLKSPLRLTLKESEKSLLTTEVGVLPVPSAKILGLPKPGEPVSVASKDFAAAVARVFHASHYGTEEEAQAAMNEYGRQLQAFLAGKEARFATDFTTAYLPASGEVSIASISRSEEKALIQRFRQKGLPGAEDLLYERFMRRKDIEAFIRTHPSKAVRRFMRNMLRTEGYVPIIERASPAQRPLYHAIARLHAVEAYSDIIKSGAVPGASNERQMWLPQLIQHAYDRDNDNDKMQVALAGISKKEEQAKVLETIERQRVAMGSTIKTIGEYLLGEKTTIAEALAKGTELGAATSLATYVSTKLTAHTGYAARARLMMGQLALSGNTMEEALTRLSKGQGGIWTKEALQPIWEYGKEEAQQRLLYAEEALKVFYQVFVKKAGPKKEALLNSIEQLHAMSQQTFSSNKEAIETAKDILRQGFGAAGGITDEVIREAGLKPVAIGKEYINAGPEKLMGGVIERLGWLFGISARTLHHMPRDTGTLELLRGVSQGKGLLPLMRVLGMDEGLQVTTIQKDSGAEAAARAAEDGVAQRLASREMPRATEVLKNILEHPVTKIAMLVGGGLAVYHTLFGGESEEPAPPIPIPRALEHDTPSIPRDPMLGGPGMDLPSIQPVMPHPSAYLTPATSPAPTVSIDARTRNPASTPVLAQSVASLSPAAGPGFMDVRYTDDREQMNPYKMEQLIRDYGNSRWVT